MPKNESSHPSQKERKQAKVESTEEPTFGCSFGFPNTCKPLAFSKETKLAEIKRAPSLSRQSQGTNRKRKSHPSCLAESDLFNKGPLPRFPQLLSWNGEEQHLPAYHTDAQVDNEVLLMALYLAGQGRRKPRVHVVMEDSSRDDDDNDKRLSK